MLNIVPRPQRHLQAIRELIQEPCRYLIGYRRNYHLPTLNVFLEDHAGPPSGPTEIGTPGVQTANRRTALRLSLCETPAALPCDAAKVKLVGGAVVLEMSINGVAEAAGTCKRGMAIGPLSSCCLGFDGDRGLLGIGSPEYSDKYLSIMREGSAQNNQRMKDK